MKKSFVLSSLIKNAAKSEIKTEAQWLGEVPYQRGLQLQLESSLAVAKIPIGRILGLEHPSVITLGRRGDTIRDLIGGANGAVSVVEVDRGGEATLHSPGQLVIYPILPLRAWGIGAREYVDLLETTTINCLQKLGVTARRSTREPGLYTDTGKITFFGLRIANGVSSHGLSINVANDLSLFSLIRSCGVTGEHLDQVCRYVDGITPQMVFSQWLRCFPLTPDFESNNS